MEKIGQFETYLLTDSDILPKQLRETFKYFKRLIMNDLDKYFGENNYWIAGGALRDYFSIGVVKSDIDIYFSKVDRPEKAARILVKNGGSVSYQNENTIRVKYKGLDIDLIKRIKESVIDTLKRFDFTVCCAAINSKMLVIHETYFMDLARKRLVINEMERPFNTLWRVQKYNAKGFFITKDELFELTKAVIHEKRHLENFESKYTHSNHSPNLDNLPEYKMLDDLDYQEREEEINNAIDELNSHYSSSQSKIQDPEIVQNTSC